MFNKSLKFILISIVVVGIVFRFYNIDRKIYWHDEVYTIFRSGGFTRDEIDRELFTNRVVAAQELEKFLAIKPQSTPADTIASLAKEDPQHPPPYFILTRLWMELFGNSVLAIRSLPALISLISLPLIYFLTLELFAGWSSDITKQIDPNLMGLIAVTLLSLSPVDILFAQTARQYSSLTLGTIGSAYFLVRALRLNETSQWLYFSLFVALSLYIHPFFALNIIALALFMIFQQRDKFLTFIFYLGVGIALYLPWIAVFFLNLDRVMATTNWATIDVGFDYLAKLWVLSYTCLFFDLDVGFDNIFTYFLRLPFLITIALGALSLIKNNNKTATFLLTSAFIPFLILVSADLVLGGKRSAVTRYLISCFPFIQITVAYFLTRLLTHKKTIGLITCSVFLLASLSSIWVSSQAKTWWNKDLSFNNAMIIQTVNAKTEPIVISDMGNDYTNTGDLIGMSGKFNQDIKLLLLAKDIELPALLSNTQETNKLLKSSPVFVFRPSLHLLNELKQAPFDYTLLY